ncbi:MAG: ankyrin repeat domain-containing protein [Thiolinea sp.]
MILKDSYQLGQPITRTDVASYYLSDGEGQKDSSNNWQLKDIEAVIDVRGNLVPYSNGVVLRMHDEHEGVIFWMNNSGQWEAVGGRDGLTGTSGKWTMRQTAAQNQQATVTPQSCTSGDRFHKAAAKGDVNYVQDCLNAGVAVDVQEGNGWTALHAAARQGQIAVIDTLLRYGANPNIRDKTGRTPLDQATLAKQQQAIDILNSQQVPPSPIAGGKGSLPPPPAPIAGGKGSLPPATGGTSMVGGVSQAAVNDPDVVRAAEFAAADLARYRPDSMTSPYLHSVVKAGKQVVAGTNYHLTIKTNDTGVYTWEVVVYEDLQGGLEITESKQIQ